MLDQIINTEDTQNLIAAGAIIIGLFGFIFIINKLFKRLYNKIAKLQGNTIKAIKYKDYQILSEEYNVRLIISAIKIIRLLLIFLIVYLCLPLIFSVLPWTQHIADQIIQWTMDPLKTIGSSFLNYLPNLFFILITALIVRFLTRILKYFSGEINKERLVIRGFHKEWSRPTFNLIRFVLYIFALVVIFPYLPGSDSAAFQGVSIFIGVLLSLGSTAFVSNFVGGLMIIYMRPFSKGDVIKVGDYSGMVISKNMLVTKIKTFKDEVISIPNKSIIENNITNYSSDEITKGIFVHTEVTIGYEVPWRKVHYIMENAAKNTEGVVQEPKPFVLQKALNDFSVAYEINAYIDNAMKMNAIKSTLLQNLQDGFAKADIEILSPHYYAYRKGEDSTIPPQRKEEE